MEADVAVNDPISHLNALANNPFIFATSMLDFYAKLGLKRHSLLLAYLVLPIALQGGRRKFLTNAKSTSNLRTMSGTNGVFNGLPELVEDYKAITNATLQYLISAGAIRIDDDAVVVVERALEGHDSPAPKGLEKATAALARFFIPYEVPMVFRMVGVFSL
jgi:hypothetical protein